MVNYFFIFKANYLNTQSFQYQCTLLVSLHPAFIIMDRSINFNHQHSIVAEEIDNEVLDWVLPSEVEPFDLSVP